MSSKASTLQNMESQVLASTKRPPLTDYDFTVAFKGTQGTVSADISMLRNIQVIQNNTFVNPKNRKKILRRKGPKAYPVSRPTGPSITHHWTRIGDEAAKQANDELLKLFINRLRAQIRKRK